MRIQRFYTLRRVSPVCRALLLTAALLLPLVAVAQSSPDKVNITGLAYDKKKKTLTVSAVSSAQPSVKLTAQGLGKLSWKDAEQSYFKVFAGVESAPDSVTVVSSAQGSELGKRRFTRSDYSSEGRSRDLTIR